MCIVNGSYGTIICHLNFHIPCSTRLSIKNLYYNSLTPKVSLTLKNAIIKFKAENTASNTAGCEWHHPRFIVYFSSDGPSIFTRFGRLATAISYWTDQIYLWFCPMVASYVLIFVCSFGSGITNKVSGHLAVRSSSFNKSRNFEWKLSTKGQKWWKSANMIRNY